jgi:hypothetical protein
VDFFLWGNSDAGLDSGCAFAGKPRRFIRQNASDGGRWLSDFYAAKAKVCTHPIPVEVRIKQQFGFTGLGAIQGVVPVAPNLRTVGSES